MSTEPEQMDILVDVTEPEPKDAEIRVEAADEKPAKVSKREIEPEEGLETLKERLEAERKARIEAEKRAHEYAQNAAKAKNEVQDTNLTLVTNAIETVRQNSEILKANYREAMSINDYDSAARIQQEMATNAAKMLQLEQGKQALESAPKEKIPDRMRHSDPVEDLASQLSPRSASWLRRNPQFATDSRLYQKMIAAHNLATADGIAPDTDEYFQSIEDTLRINRRAEVEADDPSSVAAKPTQRRSSPPAAPVSRSGTGTGSKPNVVRLTSAEREMASMMGMTDQEYAKNKVALQREGKLN